MKAGLLLPRSVLYPSMGFDILDGLKTSLKHFGIADASFATANIGVAAKDEEVYARCEQLLMDGADVIVAYINPHTAEYIHPLFISSDKLLLVLDSGFHFPSPGKRLSHAVYISLLGNLCCRIISRMAAEQEVRDVAFTCSFFDAGFRASYSFYNGITENGGSIRYNHITALKRQDFTVQPLSENMEAQGMSGILASFCGDMAEDFLREGAAIGLFEKYKIFASPFMADELWLEKLPYPGGDFVAAVPWARELSNEAQDVFLQTLSKPGKANLFSLMAWEAGMVLAGLETLDGDDAMKAIEGKTWASPRGTLYLNPDTHIMEAPVYAAVVQKDENTGNCSLHIEGAVPFREEEQLKLQRDIDTFEGTANSWFNAYPCLES